LAKGICDGDDGVIMTAISGRHGRQHYYDRGVLAGTDALFVRWIVRIAKEYAAKRQAPQSQGILGLKERDFYIYHIELR